MSIYRPGDHVKVRVPGEKTTLGKVVEVRFKIETEDAEELREHRDENGDLWLGRSEIGFD